MTPLGEALLLIAAACTDLGQPLCLVGGLAVSARAEPRMTRDADLAMSVGDDAAAEALIMKLGQFGYVVEALVEQTATRRLATVRLRNDATPGLLTDLLFASSGIESEMVAAAEMLWVLPGVEFPVATVGYLIALKLLARDDRHRPNDADDLAALRTVASVDDWQVAAEAVHLIESRGFDRGRDLRGALSRLIDHGAFQ